MVDVRLHDAFYELYVADHCLAKFCVVNDARNVDDAKAIAIRST